MLERVLEPEAMDSAQEARDYDSMDHGQVNRVLVDDFLTAAERFKLPIALGERQIGARTGAEIGSGQTGGTPRHHDSVPIEWVDILDLGAGSARIPIELCQRAWNVRIVALDMAVAMLYVAQVNVGLAGLNNRIRLDRGDAKQLGYENDSFSAIISNSIVHHIPEPLAALTEAVRVARPGGMIFFRDLIRPDSNEQHRQLVEQYAGGANAGQQAMFDASLRAALSLDEIRAMVAQVGYSPAAVAATSDRHWTWLTQKR